MEHVQVLAGSRRVREGDSVKVFGGNICLHCLSMDSRAGILAPNLLLWLTVGQSTVARGRGAFRSGQTDMDSLCICQL